MVNREEFMEEQFVRELEKLVESLNPYFTPAVDTKKFVENAVRYISNYSLDGKNASSLKKETILLETKRYIERALENSRKVKDFRIHSHDLVDVIKYNVLNLDSVLGDPIIFPGRTGRIFTGQTEQPGCNQGYCKAY